jgi:hypothetical protein
VELLEEAPPVEVEDTNPELEAMYRTLDRVLGSVQMADNKALIALTFQAGVLAGLGLIADSIKTALSPHTYGFYEWLMLGLLLVFFASLSVSTLKLFHTIAPRIAPPHSADHVSELFYFGGIANMPREQFYQRTRTMSRTQIHEAIAHIAYVNATIATKKFKNLRTSFLGLGVQMILYFSIVLLAVLQGHN